ncbi:M16 family metallopeptidase [Paucibacter sp. Y2R2-4]|uniref:M16 family metallopeptidase n=1 Tax=Paucibacter sp. Y2R2-4 TaxID=2893553 RepID=UPI0021E4A364|nr:pitrilysin family protein [Paucibacter sp. Y2R2-4]MCV2351678.1 insulinase family protein [Paucibacter sp. Y2R2-4]
MPAPALALTMPTFHQARLPNGMRLVVVERRGLPLVTALLNVQAGSLMDPPDKSGLAELSLGLLSKGAQLGSRRLDAAALAAAAESLGGGFEISTGALGSRLSLTVMTPQLDQALGLLAAVSRAPTLPEAELARSRAQMLETLQFEQSDPAALAEKLARRLFWGDAEPGRQSSAKTLSRIKRADVQAFCRQYLRPEHLSLVLAGDLDLAQGRALALRHFGQWQPRPTALPAISEAQARPDPPPEKSASALPRNLVLDLPGSGQSTVLVVAPFVGLASRASQPSLGSPGQDLTLARSGALANAVLGLGYSSRINQEVRIKRGLSYGAFSNVESLPEGGMLTLGAQTQPAKAGEVLDLLRAELRKLSEAEVTPSELAARQAVLIGELGRQLESTQGLAAAVAEQIERGEDLAELALLPQQLQALDASAVKAFASRFWGADSLRSIVVTDLALAGAGLRELLPQAWVIPAEQLDLDAASLRKTGRKP